MAYPYFPKEEGLNIVAALESPELLSMLKKGSGQSLSAEQYQQALSAIALQKQIYPEVTLLDIVEAMLQVSNLRQFAMVALRLRSMVAEHTAAGIATKRVFLLC